MEVKVQAQLFVQHNKGPRNPFAFVLYTYSIYRPGSSWRAKHSQNSTWNVQQSTGELLGRRTALLRPGRPSIQPESALGQPAGPTERPSDTDTNHKLQPRVCLLSTATRQHDGILHHTAWHSASRVVAVSVTSDRRIDHFDPWHGCGDSSTSLCGDEPEGQQWRGSHSTLPARLSPLHIRLSIRQGQGWSQRRPAAAATATTAWDGAATASTTAAAENVTHHCQDVAAGSVTHGAEGRPQRVAHTVGGQPVTAVSFSWGNGLLVVVQRKVGKPKARVQKENADGPTETGAQPNWTQIPVRH